MKISTLKSGDTVTIDSIERGAKGQLLVDGVNVKTGRKCKPKGLMQLKIRLPVEYKRVNHD